MAGLYIHVPYCKQACSYCDFFFSTQQESRPRFVRAVVEELRLRQGFLPTEPLDTLYLGGGTPSLLSPEELTELVTGITALLPLAEGAEFTLEANPDDVVDDAGGRRLQAWRRLGVNRLSLGLQSFDSAQLEWMNRAHTAAHAREAVAAVRAAGFDNLNLDAIYHLPGLGQSDWLATLETLIALAPDHLSLYSLTVEPRTALAHWVRTGRVSPAPEAAFAEQFESAHARLTAAGYEHYEISNYAQPGRRSRHNSAYWSGRGWWALGPSAEGSDGARARVRNLPNLYGYLEALEAGSLPPHETETLSDEARLNEMLLIRLRTVEGLRASDLTQVDSEVVQRWQIESRASRRAYESQGLLWQTELSLGLTLQGWQMADAITAELMLST